jgi:nucleotide-binding universal stress UspA family protein
VEEPKPDVKLHVVAAIGDASQQSTLTRLACAIAREGGSVTLLTVTPDGNRPEWLREPEECRGIRAEVETRRSDDVGRAILDAVKELEPDLLILGWRGEEGSRRYLLGSTLDPVIRYAPCEVVVARADEWLPVEHVLVAAGGGPNAATAIDLALHLSPQVHVTALYIARETAGPLGVAAGRAQLSAILEPWRQDGRV